MDVSLGLSQAVAAAAAMALFPLLSARHSGSVYPLDSGRLLLSVSLLRKGSPPTDDSEGEACSQVRPRGGTLRLVGRSEASSQALAEEFRTFLAPGAPGIPVLPVRLLPGRQSRTRRAARSLVRGFEAALVRPAQALAVSGLLTFGLAALTAAPQAAQMPGSQEGALEPARWPGQVLLADISAPRPHTFRRGWVSHFQVHQNTVLVAHSNTPLVPHSNTPLVAHSNSPLVAHSNSPLVAHSNTPLVAHSNTALVPHSNSPLVAHSNSPLVAHSNTPLVAHSNTPLVAHSNTPLVAHSNSPLVAHSNSPLVAHSNTPLVAHSNTALVPHTNTDTRPYK